ncbi:MAG: T9SS type A sorting domain-containing protein [Candidatus Cloacimonetes bacterium]|nr:T9SS type A sorting domain-containing protein [Candidatus Cloacimonadota bacterium]
MLNTTNKITTIMLIILAVMNLSVLFAQTEPQYPVNYYDDNAGTIDNPYQIETLANLRWLSETEEFYAIQFINPPIYHYFIQTNDIDASETLYWNEGNGFTPIGNLNWGANSPEGGEPYHWEAFYGSYDAQKYKISNLYIYREFGLNDRRTQAVGLFAEAWCSNISNVILENINYIIHINKPNEVVNTKIGSLMGQLTHFPNPSVNILNCIATGNITLYSDGSPLQLHTFVGGLVGNMSSGVISKSSSKVNMFDNVNFENYIASIGGLVGDATNGDIKNSYYIGNIRKIKEGGNPHFTFGTKDGGGLIGFNQSFSMQYCYVASTSEFLNSYGLFGDILGSVAPGIGECSTTSVYFDISTTGVTEVYGYLRGNMLFTDVQGYNTEAMKDISTYSGWDFTTIWDISPEINDGYPYLRDNGFDEGEPPVDEKDPFVLPATDLSSHNYPNPFNPETTISFTTFISDHISLAIFNIKGQKIKSLLNETRAAGEHQVTWNGLDDNGQSVSSGLYFYRVTAGEFQETKKMVLLK